MISQEFIEWSVEAYEQWLECESQRQKNEIEDALRLLQERLSNRYRSEKDRRYRRMHRDRRGEQCLSCHQRRQLGEKRRAKQAARSLKENPFWVDVPRFDIHKLLTS